jgi:hypothetical protein
MDSIILLDRAWPALRYEISQEAQGLLWKKNARTPFRSTHGVPSTLRHGRGHGKLVPKAAKGAAKGGGAYLTVPVLDRAGGCAGAFNTGTGVIIVHESLTQSHDHLSQTPRRQQGTAAGPLDCSFSPNHFPAVHPGRRQRVMTLLPFTCSTAHIASLRGGSPHIATRHRVGGDGGEPRARGDPWHARRRRWRGPQGAPAQARALMSARAARSKQVNSFTDSARTPHSRGTVTFRTDDSSSMIDFQKVQKVAETKVVEFELKSG